MIRAHINERFAGISGIEVVIANHPESGPPLIMRIHPDGGTTWQAHAEDATLEPTFTLPIDTGLILLDALTRHYQGAEDTRSLRRDYDAERRRVDEHAKVIADVVRTLAAKDGAA